MPPLVAPDVSYFQTALDESFNRRVLIFRATFGAHFADPKFRANADEVARLYARGDIDGAIVYCVYLASATPAEQAAFLWRQIGPKVPAWLMGTMIDVESWGGSSYSIHGDHSRQLNELAGLNAARVGWSASIAYGNRYDLASIYPGRDRRVQVIEAKYGSSVSLDVRGAIGVQYSDGQTKWGVPRVAGQRLPISTPPFGHCDHNVFPAFETGKALRAHMRPLPAKHSTPVAARPQPRPAPSHTPTPTPEPAKSTHRPAPHYKPAGAQPAAALVSPDRAHALFLNNAGQLVLRTNGVLTRRI